jgi:hypothetical protein
VSERGVCDIHPAGVGDPCNIYSAAWAITDAELRERAHPKKAPKRVQRPEPVHTAPIRDGFTKALGPGVGAQGEAHRQAKLTDDKVREMRRLREGGATLADLSARFGVSIGVVCGICKGRMWRHVA